MGERWERKEVGRKRDGRIEVGRVNVVIRRGRWGGVE